MARKGARKAFHFFINFTSGVEPQCGYSLHDEHAHDKYVRCGGGNRREASLRKSW